MSNRNSRLFSIRALSFWVGLIVLSGGLVFPLAGQDGTFTVRGTVIDTVRGDPVAGVLIRLDAGPKVLTGSRGEYEFADLPPGTYRVAIVSAECAVSFASFDAEPSSHSHLVFQVPPVETREVKSPSTPLPGSRLLTEADIEGFHVSTFAELLQRVSPDLIRSSVGQPGGRVRVVSRGVASAQAPISPILVLDGVNLGPIESQDMLDIVLPQDIAFLEVYRGASGGWSYGTGASGGVIRVARKKGGWSSSPDLDPERCLIPGWWE